MTAPNRKQTYADRARALVDRWLDVWEGAYPYPDRISFDHDSPARADLERRIADALRRAEQKKP